MKQISGDYCRQKCCVHNTSCETYPPAVFVTFFVSFFAFPCTGFRYPSSMDTFKVPKIKRAGETFEGIPRFNFNDLVIKDKIGSGSFGHVIGAEWKGTMCVVKQPHEVIGNAREFHKEVKLLHSVKGHENIVELTAYVTAYLSKGGSVTLNQSSL